MDGREHYARVAEEAKVPPGEKFGDQGCCIETHNGACDAIATAIRLCDHRASDVASKELGALRHVWAVFLQDADECIEVDADKLWEAGVRAGLVVQEPYDPGKHREDMDAEEGDLIYALTPMGHAAFKAGQALEVQFQEGTAMRKAELSEFHWTAGWYFKRIEDGPTPGSVRLVKVGDDRQSIIASAIIPANEWESIISAVSAKGGQRPYNDAVAFHMEP